ncbi:hypothetical protein SCLCIDRAFT_1213000 [Scleroderma citrinum Foug A]|uniref:Uncharacterized protein n=1 Tax=Scleroderma citrinum Foug A TaxID=1036808 RepID=A0A0C3DWD8_9AGAM|nr:hypothetical protein SCLCIDRAFT_1213000 [Scleroderma citrinum Foug A]
MLGRLVLVAAALLGTASAQLTITNPTSDSWWVAQSSNTLAWTCDTSTYSNFTVLLANSNPSILVQPIAIIAIEPNYDCSKTITQQQASQPPSTGYTVLLANPLNSSDVYATSQSFEIKALGSSYPATSASSSPTGTSGSSSASPSSSTGKSGGALAQYVPAGVGMAIALAMGVVVA